MNTRLQNKLNIKHPILMAPMFLVSNQDMLKAAIDNGIVGAIPSLNFLTNETLESSIKELTAYKRNKAGTFGFNLIIKGNPKYEAHLKILSDNNVPLIITSLGDPSEVIEKVHAYGGTVLCDVTNLKHAEKASAADGFIAVGQGAGGHAGPISLQVLVPMLRNAFPDKIIIGAGGIASYESYQSVLSLGADGISAGTAFIASKESTVPQAYKDAIIKAKASDIVMTRILSGTPSTVIKSDYLLELEEALKQQNLNLSRGIEILQKAGVNADYKSIFVAGQAVEFVNQELTVSEIIRSITLKK
jgi:nitronate monooxygenase